MYSILISNNSKYTYYTNSDGSNYVAEDLVAVGAKVMELLSTYTLNQITVVKNCIITGTIEVEEATI